MIDYDLLEAVQQTTTVQVIEVVPTVSEQVVTRLLPTRDFRTTDKALPPEHWEWEQVRDYVIRNIEQYHGPFPRNLKTEHAIFKSFTTRWESKAGLIAQAAFEIHHGMWRGSPITVNRFCKASDEYFACFLAEGL